MIQVANNVKDKSSSSDTLQRKIELRQRRISQKIDQISHDLDPSILMKKGVDEFTDAMSSNLGDKIDEWSKRATTAIKRDPLPVTIAVAALAYWAVKSKNK